MGSKPLHLAWFTGAHVPNWRGAFPGPGDPKNWTNGEPFIRLAQALERACFDFFMIEDSPAVPDEFGEQPLVAGVKHGGVRLDPLVLAPTLAQHTERLGLVATLSTTFYPPYLLARAVQTMDHLSQGRSAWNVVTSSGDNAARNFGHDQLQEHDSRYERAEEFMQVVKGLWSTWEPDAVVMDRESGVYADGSKVHYLDHKGKYYASKGPINVPPAPWGQPVICQAGSSSAGKAFGSKHADIILAVPTGRERMKKFVEEQRAAIAEAGRDPQSVKIMFILQPVIGDTDEDAQRRWDALYELTDENVEHGLIAMSEIVHIDFSKIPLDEPLPKDLTTNGHQSSLANLYYYGETVREIAVRWIRHFTMPEMVGAPATVAERMGELMEEVGGDGYLITGDLSTDFITRITEGLVPELQRRGLARTAYAGPTLRENLLAF